MTFCHGELIEISCLPGNTLQENAELALDACLLDAFFHLGIRFTSLFA